ncbi:PBP1A family penicillin-binding protein [Rhizobium helianthi]|uniref:peptidoglycan glycosyltransferase n=1 Tax=Rhizobium helianthi TaxID=1132695 RepID=A0ABW4M0I1_9HYPH
MASGKKSGERVEPSFGSDERAEDEVRIDADDRISGRAQPRRTRQEREDPPRRKRAIERDFDDFEDDDEEEEDERPARKRRRAPKRAKPARRGLFASIRRLIYWCIVLGIWVAIGIGGLVAYYAAQMPSASTWAIPDRPPNVKITALDGTLVANRGTTGGEAIALEEMSPFIPQAVISIEDRRFYYHFGVDPLGLARAFVNNLTGQSIQGGSTITQQLAKNLFLSPERTFERKIQEVLLSFWLEHKFTKDQILALYLNRMFFGSNAYGVEAASQRYFGKSARDVNLAEAATLAGLLKAPTRLSPARDPKAAEERAQVVMGAMREEGYITADEIKTAMSQPPAKAKRYWSGAEHYAADMVMDEVKSILGEVKTDINVQTTLDLRLEKDAEKALTEALEKEGAKVNASQAALVSVDATGAIRAVVGGRDYADSQFNRAAKAKRQPGSAFKPFVYAAALEAGYRPDTIMTDGPVKIGTWTPENYDQKYRGQVTLSTALAHSLNTIAAQLVMQVGPKNVISLAHRLGVESDLQDNASIALGTSEVTLVELTASYAAFMNGGMKATPHLVSRITDNSGKVLYEADYSGPPRVLSEQVVANLNGMLNRVMTEGTGRAAQLAKWQAAGKSGTTQSFRDAIFVGFTSTMTTGIWFGNDDGTPMKKVTGGGLPARTWKNYMTAALEGYKPTPLFGVGIRPAAPEAQTTLGDFLSGVLPGGGPSTNEDFPPAPDAPPEGAMPQNQAAYPPADDPQAYPQQEPPVYQQRNQPAYPPVQQRAVQPRNDPYTVPPGDVPQRDYRDYREYRGPQDGPVPPDAVLEGRAPPDAVLEGPVPPGDIGGGSPRRAPRDTTLFDIIMGQ